MQPDCLYFEGACRGVPHGKDLRISARSAFAVLIQKLGLRPPKLVACGSRNDAYEQFCGAHNLAQAAQFVALLVDSEDPVRDLKRIWSHLNARDGWSRPDGAAEDQVMVMVTCMEAWIAADRATLFSAAGPRFEPGGLAAPQNVETTDRASLLRDLEHATRNCSRPYQKGRRSFELLAELDPAVLRTHLASFRDFEAKLRAKLTPLQYD
ncbi:MAG: DUF4276 family protein [Fimbriimonadaceae bacterium]|nr:DUF4276 family protein [Fimbriimonadaceae bacterium]